MYIYIYIYIILYCILYMYVYIIYNVMGYYTARYHLGVYVMYVYICIYIYIHMRVFRPSQDSSVWLGLTSTEQLMSP